MAAHTYKPSTWEAEAEGLLHEANLVCRESSRIVLYTVRARLEDRDRVGRDRDQPLKLIW